MLAREKRPVTGRACMQNREAARPLPYEFTRMRLPSRPEPTLYTSDARLACTEAAGNKKRIGIRG